MFDAQVTFAYTADLEATARFYEDVLGLTLSLDQGTCRIYRAAANAHLGFCTREAGPAPDGVILTLVTQDVDAWAERLRAAGVPLDKEPTHSERYNIYHCFFRDPNGYLLEIQRFEDPAWVA